VLGRPAQLHIIQLALLMDIDEDVGIHHFLKPRALHLARLKYGVAIGKITVGPQAPKRSSTSRELG